MRRSIFLIIALWLAVLPAHAASPAELRAYGLAANAFNAGLWDRADRELSSFIAKYPGSTNTAEAILLQAQARVQLGRLAEATDLLATNWTAAGGLADEYLFWTAEIYYQRTNYANASKIFARLAVEFPQSNHRLEAVLGEAASEAELQHWPQVAGLLGDPKGVFQLTATPNGTNEVIYRGGLLLAQAQLAQQNFGPAESVLTDLADWRVSRSLKWQRQYLLCRVQLADERPEDALRSANDLAALTDTAELRAESVEMRASILQHLQRNDEAIVAYRLNLAADIPVAHQQEALFKIAELSLSLGKVADATQQLETFLRQNTNSPVADVVWFTLGDMQLKQYLAGIDTNAAPDIATNSAGLNFLRSAMARFQALRDKFPASSLVGRSYLHEGWCDWFSDDWVASEASFQAAAHRLPFSEDQMIARFKWADSQSRLKDFTGAITNYNFVVTHAAPSADPQVQDLVEPALYQLLRASFDAGDVRAGSDALAKILNMYPDSFIAARALFLSGQGLSLRKDTAQARDLFSEVERRFPNSPYLPEARLAIARTYEQEEKWTNAIAQYDDWLATFTNNPARPRVEYYRSWANFQAGDETNALTLFTNFVAKFPNDSLAPSAQWWVADHFFREGDFPNAEKNYKAIFQNASWMSSDLNIEARRIGYEARLMAGRAALARSGYADAFSHFTNLTSDASCPADIWAQAVFAYGDATMM
ncbi:MAG TPA: tetratricopeptide repeat protein, partial [Verrucomicrobiae bacterium]|nr:tetratricopeptide repeat protein [Verrucomicrobiae bacterium]